MHNFDVKDENGGASKRNRVLSTNLILTVAHLPDGGLYGDKVTNEKRAAAGVQPCQTS